MSAITSSGASTVSVVTKWCPGRSASSLPRKKRSTPANRIVATGRSVTRFRATIRLVTGEKLAHGLELMRRGEFFEAHEELELAWRAAPVEERDFFQGLVHVA